MKNTYILLLISAAFFAADSLHSADKYFGDTSAVFTSNTAWFSDEARTERTTPPTSGEDTAIFYKTTGKDCWITQIDTYVGNIVSAGGSTINLGKENLNQSVPVNFQVYGKLSAQICDEAGTMSFGTSFESEEGNAAVELVFGEIEVGAQVYGGRTYDSYQNASLYFNYLDSRISSSLITVNGDVKIGGCATEGVNSAAIMNIGADKMKVSGIMKIERNGWGYSNVIMHKASVLELGGLAATNTNGDFTIANGTGGSFASEIVFKNATGTDCQYIGSIVDDGNNRADISAINAVMNVTMDGEGTQRIFQAVQSKTDILGRMGGTYAAKSGRLFMDNSRIAADYRLAALSLEGGLFGAGHYDSSQAGAAYFKSANFQSGGLAYENFANHNAVETQASDKIIITETFSKAAGSGKISVDFSDKDGNALNLSEYAVADEVSGIENWVEILTAGSLDGFDLESKLGGNIYDANGDFYAVGIENGVAVFRWAESPESGYALQVGFAQVPEPAAAAAVLGAIALGLAARGRRR